MLLLCTDALATGSLDKCHAYILMFIFLIIGPTTNSDKEKETAKAKMAAEDSQLTLVLESQTIREHCVAVDMTLFACVCVVETEI